MTKTHLQIAEELWKEEEKYKDKFIGDHINEEKMQQHLSDCKMFLEFPVNTLVDLFPTYKGLKELKEDLSSAIKYYTEKGVK